MKDQSAVRSNLVRLPTNTRIQRPRNTRRVESFGVVAQVQQALRRETLLATCIGFLLGGFVPAATFVVAHYEIDHAVPIYAQLASLLVAAGLAYSAKTVYEWGQLAFQMPLKALGFVVLVEGVMILSTHAALSFAALGYLILINGIATGCTLSVKSAESTKV